MTGDREKLDEFERVHAAELNNVPVVVVAQPGVLTLHKVHGRYPLSRVRSVMFGGERLRCLVLQSVQMEHNEILIRPGAPLESFGIVKAGGFELCTLWGDELPPFPMVSATGPGVRVLLLNRHTEPVSVVIRVEFAAP